MYSYSIYAFIKNYKKIVPLLIPFSTCEDKWELRSLFSAPGWRIWLHIRSDPYYIPTWLKLGRLGLNIDRYSAMCILWLYFASWICPSNFCTSTYTWIMRSILNKSHGCTPSAVPTWVMEIGNLCLIELNSFTDRYVFKQLYQEVYTYYAAKCAYNLFNNIKLLRIACPQYHSKTMLFCL